MKDMLVKFRRSDSAGQSRPPRLLKQRSSTAFIMVTICMAVFTDVFLYGIIVPVMPFALGRAGVRADDVQKWVSIQLAVYGGALLGAGPVCGYFADRTTSRRLPLLLGLFALGGGTAMLCADSGVGLLVAGRICQGLSAGMVWTVGLALLVDTVGPSQLAVFMGYVSTAMAVGTLTGPLLAGLVYARGGYYAVFAMAFGFIVLDVILRLVMIEKKIARKWHAADGRDYGSSSSTPAAAGAEGKSRAVSEEDEEQQEPVMKRRRKLPPVVTLLKSPRLMAALWGCLVTAAILSSFDSTLPLFVNRMFEWNSIGAGLVFLPVMVPTFISPVIGMACNRWGSRWIASMAFISLVPFLVLLRLVTHNTLGQKVLLFALLFLVGLCIECALLPLMTEVSYVVDAQETARPGIHGTAGAYAQAYGLFTCSYAAGTLVGPLWAGFVEAKAGWGTMAWSLGVLSAVTAATTVIWVGEPVRKPNRRTKTRREVTV